MTKNSVFRLTRGCCYASLDVSEILGKVTGTMDLPRGADVSLRIVVPRLWLLEGRAIEVALPRNLVCANCSGGGCGRCENSGAITVRGRGELPEMVQVCLPEQNDAKTRESMHDIALRDGIESRPGSGGKAVMKRVRPMTIRIPECGGLPNLELKATVRGWLLLHVGIAEQPSANVRLLDDVEQLSSSKMSQAEAKCSAKDEAVCNVEASVTGDATSALGNGSMTDEQPLSTRVAKVRSLRASDPESVKRASRERNEPSRRLGRVMGLSVAIVVAAATSLWMWYWR